MPLPKDELHLYFRKHPAQRGGGWQNMAPARLALVSTRAVGGRTLPCGCVDELRHRHTFERLKSNPTPLTNLFATSHLSAWGSTLRSTLCPASVVRDASKLVGGNTAAEFLTLNCGHFGEPPFAPPASPPTNPLTPIHRAPGTYYDANFDQASEKMSSFFFSKFDE